MSDAAIPEPPWDHLRAEARRMSAAAYAPYSGVHVGAAALVDDGRIVTGANVENASYGLTLCAECSVASALVSSGGGRLVALAVVGMSAFFAAVVRSPLTGIVLVTEMTASASLFVPMLVANLLAGASALLASRLAPGDPLPKTVTAPNEMPAPYALVCAQGRCSLPVTDGDLLRERIEDALRG